MSLTSEQIRRMKLGKQRRPERRRCDEGMILGTAFLVWFVAYVAVRIIWF